MLVFRSSHTCRHPWTLHVRAGREGRNLPGCWCPTGLSACQVCSPSHWAQGVVWPWQAVLPLPTPWALEVLPHTPEPAGQCPLFWKQGEALNIASPQFCILKQLLLNVAALRGLSFFQWLLYIKCKKSLWMLYSPKLSMESYQMSCILLFSPKSTASVLNCFHLSETSPKRDLCPVTLSVLMFRIDMRWDRHRKCPWPKFLGAPCLETASFPMDSEFLNSGLQQLW